jgi:phospholipase/carboxylesterase
MDSSSLIFKVAPVSTNDSGPHPTLVFLHGRGTDENDLLGLTSHLDPHFLVASVRAPYKFAYGGYTWFDMDDSGEPDIDQLLQSCDSFLHWLNEFQREYPVDSTKLFLFGFSMGAMISMSLSLLNPERFKGIVAHSGVLPHHDRLIYQWEGLHSLSFYVAHGKFDSIIPVQLGRQLHQRLMQAHANVVYQEYPIQHTISEESLNDAARWLQSQIES